jgi:hypothetical protein
MKSSKLQSVRFHVLTVVNGESMVFIDRTMNMEGAGSSERHVFMCQTV